MWDWGWYPLSLVCKICVSIVCLLAIPSRLVYVCISFLDPAYRNFPFLEIVRLESNTAYVVCFGYKMFGFRCEARRTFIHNRYIYHRTVCFSIVPSYPGFFVTDQYCEDTLYLSQMSIILLSSSSHLAFVIPYLSKIKLWNSLQAYQKLSSTIFMRRMSSSFITTMEYLSFNLIIY